jgi:hypothetical protein
MQTCFENKKKIIMENERNNELREAMIAMLISSNRKQKYDKQRQREA